MIKNLTKNHSYESKENLKRVNHDKLVEPFRKKVDLKKLVGKKIYDKVINFENLSFTNTSSVRGKKIKFYTPNQRILWQSFGQEYIEPELLDFIESIPQKGIFFDVGASTGVFAIYSAMLGKLTYCFEPEVSNFNILNINSYLNKKKIKSKFHHYNIALADKKSISKISIKKFQPGAHEKHLEKNLFKKSKKVNNMEYIQSILTLTMDEFIKISKSVPSDLKIDVDGAELMVINGMKKILKNQILKRIFIEISEKNISSKKALKKILSYGFKVQKRNRVQNYIDLNNYILIRK